ncbi:MAG: ribosome silencing factor [Bacteroidetes bacterium]|jgi:ribosome-associated protein|nr:ribosome silencing factor [Bacteroidota bacterium]
MTKKTSSFSLAELRDAIVEGAQEKKARDIVALNLQKLSNASVDYYIVCHGQSDRQAEAIAKSIEETVFNTLGIWPYHSEGYQNREWILLDYFDIVAHIFVERQRNFYAIEDLWADAHVEHYETII